MREECVLLEHISDAPMLGSEIDPAFGVEEHRLAEPNGSGLRPKQPGDHAEHGRLPGARGPDERERLPLGDRQLGGRVEAAKGVSEPEPECHLVRSLTDNRTRALMTISSALMARATVKSRSNCS